MLGVNCSIYGCGTSRKHTGISIFQIPAKDDDLSTNTREACVRIVTKVGDRLKFRKANRSNKELLILVKGTSKRTSSKHVSLARCKM